MTFHAAVEGSWCASGMVQLTNCPKRKWKRSYVSSGTLSAYWLLEAKLASPGFHRFRGEEQEVSFAISGKNLLGADGPAPGFSGVDYPLAPRALWLQMDLVF